MQIATLLLTVFSVYTWQRISALNLQFWKCLQKLLDDTKYWCRLPYRKPPKPTVCRYFKCYLRYLGQNDERHASMYPILLRRNAKIRINFIFTISRRHLMCYVKMIFHVTFHLTANQWQSIKAREILFAALERVLKYLIRHYNFKVAEAKYSLWKWSIWVKILISKGYIRKYNIRNVM